MYKGVKIKRNIKLYITKSYEMEVFLCISIYNPLVEGLSSVTPSTQATENKAVTETNTPVTNSENKKLAPSLFSDSEIDADLKSIIERWPTLSVELRQAIVKMVR